MDGGEQLLIPDYLAAEQPKDAVNVFTELRDQSARQQRRVVHLAGKELPLATIVGVASADECGDG